MIRLIPQSCLDSHASIPMPMPLYCRPYVQYLVCTLKGGEGKKQETRHDGSDDTSEKSVPREMKPRGDSLIHLSLDRYKADIIARSS